LSTIPSKNIKTPEALGDFVSHNIPGRIKDDHLTIYLRSSVTRKIRGDVLATDKKWRLRPIKSKGS
jgi:hypothetical protein